MLLRLLFLVLVFCSLFLLNICCGDIFVPPSQVLACLNDHGALDEAVRNIVLHIRFPRVLIAMVVGAALSVAGLVLQNISRNELADPYLTGVSSGAGLAVAIALWLKADLLYVPFFAFAGGLIVSTIVARLAKGAEGLSISRLLLAGIGVSAIASAVMTLFHAINPVFSQTQALLFWLAGGIAGRTWTEFMPAMICTVCGTTSIFVLSKPLRLLSLGPDAALSLGLNVPLIQWALLAAAVLLCAGAVSVSGLVGFVGLIGPHIARRLFGSDERLQIVSSAVVGASLVMVSDFGARSILSGQELPLGTLLSLCGGPFFLWLLQRQRDVA